MKHWPAIDAWQRTPGLEIASAIPTIADQRRRLLTKIYDFLPGLLANLEMAQRSIPALSKPVTGSSLPRPSY
jgi:hypothetical protein